MQGYTRKIVQAISYEVIALIIISPIISWVFGDNIAHSITLVIVLATIAMIWNVIFNHLFELWEKKQEITYRGFFHRLLHSLGFEGGIIIVTIPVIAMWLNLSWGNAFYTDISLFIFYFFYSYLFQWGFDKVFGLPNTIRPSRGISH